MSAEFNVRFISRIGPTFHISFTGEIRQRKRYGLRVQFVFVQCYSRPGYGRSKMLFVGIGVEMCQIGEIRGTVQSWDIVHQNVQR